MKMKTAPMGWNSWDCYGAAVTEDIVRRNAEFMAEHLKEYGWEYIVVDIQWYEPYAATNEYHPFADVVMDEYGRLLPAVNRFPSAANGAGFGPLAEYVHSLGLKFGIHIMRGIPRQAVHQNTKIMNSDRHAREIAKTNSICAWNTDMYGVDPEKDGAREYYNSIFELYASWGVDFIKCDDIARELPHEESELIMLSKALHGCGRPMVLSLSPGPALLEKAELYKQISNMWRITDDFWDKWELLYDMFSRAEKWCTHADVYKRQHRLRVIFFSLTFTLNCCCIDSSICLIVVSSECTAIIPLSIRDNLTNDCIKKSNFSVCSKMVAISS